MSVWESPFLSKTLRYPSYLALASVPVVLLGADVVSARRI
jgi:hypothetical protein